MNNQNVKALYFSFRGRISRGTFWLHGIIILPGLTFLAGLIYLGLWDLVFPERNEILLVIQVIIGFIILVFIELAFLALNVKRCHDRNRSGWFILVTLIPIVGPFWYLAEIMLTSGTQGENRFGKGPLQLDEKIVTRSYLKSGDSESDEPKQQTLFRIGNIIGLAFSITICTICITYIQNELSYDRFHEKHEQIHRVGMNLQLNNESYNGVITPAPMAKALVAEYHEIERATRVKRGWGRVQAPSENRQYKEDRIYYVDSDFFEIFNLQFIDGDAGTAFTDSNSVVITDETAVKYFGDQNPLGKVLILDDRSEYQITGIVEKFPQNSHFHFDFLAFLHDNPDNANNWFNFNYYTYLLLGENHSPELLEGTFSDFTDKHFSHELFQDLKDGLTFYLQPITNIHFDSHTTSELETNGKLANVKIAFAAALLILLFTCFNFVSLVSTRINEIKNKTFDKKILLSTSRQQYKILIKEALFGALIALIAAIGLIRIFIPYTSSFLPYGLELSIDQTIFLSGLVCAIFIVIICFIGYLFIAIFPYRVVNVIINGGLTSLQTGLVLLLLICTFQVYQQLHFLQKKDLGFDLSGIVVIDLWEPEYNSDSLKSAILKNPDILNATKITGQLPPSNSLHFRMDGMSADEGIIMQSLGVDYDFLNVMGIELLEGRNASKGIPIVEEGTAIINETAARYFGLDQALGRQLIMEGEQPYAYQIIGVMEDVHFESLHGSIEPLVILSDRSMNSRLLMVKIENNKIQSGIFFIEETLKQFGVDTPLEYSHPDDTYNNMYSLEERLARLLTFASIVALFICCYSIYGLLAYFRYYRQRQTYLSPFILYLTFGPALAYYVSINSWSVAYTLMEKWLQSFAYRVDILNASSFVLPTFIFIVISMLVTILAFESNRRSE